MFAPGPIRVLRTTRAPCIAAFGNLEPARAALMQLRALVGSGEWRWQRQLERALSLRNLWGCMREHQPSDAHGAPQDVSQIIEKAL